MNITKNATWLLVCRISGDLLNLLQFVLISRSFGPAGVGVYSYGFAVASFIYVIGCLGIEEYGLREYARMRSLQRPAFVAELLGTQVILIIAALVGLAVYLCLTSPTWATLFIVLCMAAYQVTTALAATLFIPAMGQQRMAGPAVADLAARIVAFAIVIGSIYAWGASLAHSMLGFPIAGAALILLAVKSARKHGGVLTIAVSAAAIKRILGVLWSFAAIELFAQLFTRVGIIALALTVSDAAAGIYATGLRLIEVGLMPLAFLGVAVYPRLSQLYREDLPAFRQMGQNLVWATLLISGGLTWGLYYAAPLLLVPILGERYASSAPVIKIMAALGVVQGCEIAMGRLLLSADRQTVRAAAIAVGSIAALVLNLVLIPKFGISGSIMATVLSYLIIDVLYFSQLRAPMTVEILARAVVILALAVIAAAGVAWLSDAFGSPYWAQAAGAAGISLVTFGIGYYAAVLRRRIGGRARS